MSHITFSYTGPESATSATTVGSTVNIAIEGTAYQDSSGATTPFFEIVLYADTTAWDGWAAQRSTTDATDTDHFENYSSYAMSWYCNLDGVQSGTKDGSGCCLRDREQDGGGYCISQQPADHPATYWMVEADFETATTVSEYNLPSPKIVAKTSANEGFETFLCDHAVDSYMKCNKLQLWPAASYSGGFRFEKDRKVEAYFYDVTQTGIERWRANNVFFLTGATSLAAAAGVLAVLGLSVV